MKSRGSRSVVSTLICSKKAPDHIRSHPSIPRRLCLCRRVSIPQRLAEETQTLKRSLSSKLVPNTAEPGSWSADYLFTLNWLSSVFVSTNSGRRTDRFLPKAKLGRPGQVHTYGIIFISMAVGEFLCQYFLLLIDCWHIFSEPDLIFIECLLLSIHFAMFAVGSGTTAKLKFICCGELCN